MDTIVIPANFTEDLEKKVMDWKCKRLSQNQFLIEECSDWTEDKTEHIKD